MNVLRSLIDEAVGTVIAEHPKYFSPKGQEKAQAAITRKIMAAFRDDDSSKDGRPPTETEPAFYMADPASREARGYVNLRKLAGAVEPKKADDGTIIIPKDAYVEQVFALAELPPRDGWLFVTDRQQVGAWMNFFREKLPAVGRRSITESRGDQVGILMPFPFPPSKAGKLYNAG